MAGGPVLPRPRAASPDQAAAAGREGPAIGGTGEGSAEAQSGLINESR